MGRLVSEKYNKEIPNNTYLGYASIGEFVPSAKYVYQSHAIIRDNYVGDYVFSVENISDENWSKGISKTFAGVVVKRDSIIDNYVGRELALQNGETRIINAIEHSGAYTNIFVSGAVIDSGAFDPLVAIRLVDGPPHSELIYLTPYLSQWGIQGLIFSKLYNNLSMSINSLYTLNSLLFAMSIAVLTMLYARIISTEFAITFLVTIILSPWIISFSRNLYWIPFTWFAPAIFAALYFLTNNSPRKWFWIALLYASFVFKCLAGYEYISAIILLASAIFLYDFFNPNRRLTRTEALGGGAIVCAVGVAGFVTALAIHAGMRGDGVLDGIRNIYEIDVKRRTYGDPNAFGAESYAALSASPLAIIAEYVCVWRTEFIKFIPGYLFYVLILTSVATISYRMYASHRNMARDAGLFIAFLLPPLSWFILAKGHSGVHTHMNYVLWYFGFSACIVYLSFNGLKIAIANIVSWAKATNADKI